ncbi:MAG TPA: hypothetical protein VFM46_10630 [Pseudomonadales bacterium]|nr:hypothetical protein [Pseudomonadales bacterium]
MDTTKPTDISTDESEEIRKLKREIEELKEERDFLKKAADGWLPPFSQIKSDEVGLYRRAANRTYHRENEPLVGYEPCGLL